MSGSRDLEYTEVLTAIRHQLDYRLKILTIAIAFNGVLLTVVFQHLQQKPEKILGCVFGLFTTILLLLAERRSVHVARLHADYGMKLEEDLGFNLIGDVVGALRQSNRRFRTSFALLYWLVIVLWLAEVVNVVVV